MENSVNMAVNFICSKYSNKEPVMHSKVDNKEVMINDKADGFIEKNFNSFLNRYQNNLKNLMEANEFASIMFI